MTFDIRGNADERALVQSALDLCDFPWTLLEPSLRAEGRTTVPVEFADLSRFLASDEDEQDRPHDHADGEPHAIERVVGERLRVLGLFYLPPHTRIVLDRGLLGMPDLAREVFVAEAAHLVDYHWIVPSRPTARAAVWNALHPEHQDVDPDAVLPESGDVDHGHSWFDGHAGYASWVGEAFMEAFGRAFAPNVRQSIALDHPTSPEAAATVRRALLEGIVYRGRGGTFHDSHRGITAREWFPDAAAARTAGLSPCRVCRPR